MKKIQKFLISTLCVVVGAGVLVACGGDEGSNKGDGKVTVTFYDATGTNSPSEMTVVKTVKIDKDTKLTVGADGTVDGYTPTKDGGYEFVNWFATPSKSHVFDFSEAISENVSVYGGFSKYVADTRDFYIIGAGTSSVLVDGWGVINDDHKFTKAEGNNEYSLTLDLKANDEFVLVSSADYTAKRGAGYLVKYTLSDGTEVFAGEGSVYDDSTKGANIKVKYDGNYTLTLTTHPNEDYYNTAGTGYTEERKEIYNLNPYDTIDFKRNGDVQQAVSVKTDLYIKGANITAWQDMVNAATTMTNNSGVYSLEIYLEQGDQFMFASRNTDISTGDTSEGSIYVKAENLDEASKAYVDGDSGDMTAKASGKYTFSYNASTEKLTVTFDSSATLKEYDYYLDGAIGDGDWGDYLADKSGKLIKGDGHEYTLSGVQLAADEEFVLRAHEVDEATLDWGNVKAAYNFTYLRDNTAFAAANPAGSNYNIKVVTAGTYDITFNSYSKIITITQHSESADTLDIYIKGANINGWSHDWDEEWLMTLSDDQTKYEFTLTVTEGNAVEFGLEKHPKGEKTGYGDFLGASSLGTDGDANAAFTPESGSNFKCDTAGTYKIVYTIATGKVDFYTVTE